MSAWFRRVPALHLRWRDERPLAAVPRAVQLALCGALAAQIAWQAVHAPAAPRAQDLPAPPPAGAVRVLALDEPAAAARASMLWLQAFDNQPGVSVPFRELDYERLAAWLDLILELDPRFDYPLLAASRVYAEVPVPDKQRRMTELVHRHFLQDPDRRWRWQAHIVYVARHRIGDGALGLRYAEALARHTTPGRVPGWARQMRIFVLADMGEVQAAMVLLGALIESGEVTDAAELRFLRQRLEDLRAAAGR